MSNAEPVDLAAKRGDVTRDAIRQALASILEEEHPAAISVPAVARKAGISVRTIYRYFPSKQALLDDFSEIQIRRLNKMTPAPTSIDADPEKWLPVFWTHFAEDVSAVRAQHYSPAGADIRDRRLGATRERALKVVAKRHQDIDEDDQVKLADAVVAVMSSGMFLELYDRLGYDPVESADLAVWIVRSMQEKLDRDGSIK